MTDTTNYLLPNAPGNKKQLFKNDVRQFVSFLDILIP